MPASFRLSCAGRSDPADLSLVECASLEELIDELQLALPAVEGKLVVDLRPGPRPPFSVPQALEAIVRELEHAPSTLEVRCLVANERARSVLTRCLPAAQRPRLETRCGSISVQLECGDITRVHADALVNASNTRLELGGGVSGAIRSASSDPGALQAAMRRLAPLDEGRAVITASHGLPTPRLIHVATANGRAETIAGGFRAVLELCAEHEFETLALPALGAGTGGLSNAASARLIATALAQVSAACPRLVRIVTYERNAFDSFAAVFSDLASPA